MAIKFLSDIDSARNNTDINTDGVYQMNGTTVLDGTSTYTRLYNPEGAVCLYLGDGGDRTNYYDNNAHRFRGAGGSGDKMFINGSGNVGIGTTSPAQRLHVNSGANNTTAIFESTDGNANITIKDNAGEVALSAGGNSMYFKTSSSQTTRMAIVGSAGNVGIGTTSPDSPLHVNTGSGTGNANTVIIDRTGSSDYSGVSFATAGTVDWSIGQNSAGNFEVFEDGLDSKTRLTVKAGGNVGIGTSSPDRTLSVHSPDNTRIEIKDTTENIISHWGVNSGAMFITTETNHPINLYTNSTKRLTIDSSALTLTTTATNQSIVYWGTNTAYGIRGGGNYGYMGYNTGGYHRFMYAGTELMRITSTGNVGIGTTSPSSKLHVAGAIKTTGDVTMSSNTTLHIGNVDLTTGSGGNTVSVEAATSSGTAMNFKTSSGTVAAYMVYQGTTTTRFAGRVEPSGNRTLDLGTDALRWRVVYCETLDSAGQHESNLQDREQPVGQYITGTVLAWKNGKNRPCTQFADHMRMGIAVLGQDSPLVQGAEPVLCTGIVEEGDYLVTSEKEGHAVAIPRHIVKEQLLFDCVIGKALQDGEGESHLIKTWINI